MVDHITVFLGDGLLPQVSLDGVDGFMLPENSFAPYIFDQFPKFLCSFLENQQLHLQIPEHFDFCQVYCYVECVGLYAPA